MTSTRDVHDMLGLTADQVSRPKPKKKGKPTFKKPDGMAREVFSLLGERAPPIPLAEPSQYKAKRRVGPSEVSQWRDTSFHVTSRNDGLVLRHWTKQLDEPAKPSETSTPAENSTPGADKEAEDEEETSQPLPPNVLASRDRNLTRIRRSVKERQVKEEPSSDEYKFSKYNVEIPKPVYDDAVYTQHLESDTWTREQTDRLVDLYSEYSGKWPVIVDRWDDNVSADGNAENAEPNGDSSDAASYKPRSMEELKSRFYTISAKLMQLKTPISQMSPAEFNNHEKMAKFDAKQESDRKRYKEAIMARSKSEREEERLLLAELDRMYKRQEQFEVEVRDLRARLDHTLTDDIPNTQLYTTSQEITGLFSKFIQRDKNNKLRRSINDPTGASSSPTSASAQNPAAAAAAASNQQGNKRSSLSNQTNASGRRALSPASETRFGVSTHDRLTFGVTFKSDRIAKARMAKSQSKTEKIAIMLTELGVPELIHIPTNPICSAMEDLVKKINLLIDQRRVLEKQENDLKVAKEVKAQKEGTSTEDQPNDQEPAAAVPAEQKQEEPSKVEDTDPTEAEAEAEAEADEQTGEEDAENVDAEGDVDIPDAPPSTTENDEAEQDEDQASVDTREVEVDTETSRPSTRGNPSTRNTKRSASVLSASSTGSAKSRSISKRQKSSRS